MKFAHSCHQVALVVLALGLALHAPSRTQAQQRAELMPYAGETAAEFEARRHGLSAPAPAAEPLPVTLTPDARGHFYAEPTVNGTPVRMLVDTGASTIALSTEDARKIGVVPSPDQFVIKLSTANGVVLAAPVMLREVAIGNISVPKVLAVVSAENTLQTSLLGMSFLSRLSHYEVRNGTLILDR